MKDKITMNQIEVDILFSAGHRLLGYNGPCSHYHGHNYMASVVIQCSTLNYMSMVVDFSDIKREVKKWIDDHWDHNMILHADDPMLDAIAAQLLNLQKKPFEMPRNENPTAEAMAIVLMEQVDEILNILGEDYLLCTCVTIQETPSSTASCIKD